MLSIAAAASCKNNIYNNKYLNAYHAEKKI